MAVERGKLFALLQAAGVETRFRDHFGDIVLKYKGKTRFLKLADGDFKIRDIRHMLGQLDLPGELVKERLPEV